MVANLVVGLDTGSFYHAALDLHGVRHDVHYHVGETLVISNIRHGLGRKSPRPVETGFLDPGRIFFRHGDDCIQHCKE